MSQPATPPWLTGADARRLLPLGALACVVAYVALAPPTEPYAITSLIVRVLLYGLALRSFVAVSSVARDAVRRRRLAALPVALQSDTLSLAGVTFARDDIWDVRAVVHDDGLVRVFLIHAPRDGEAITEVPAGAFGAGMDTVDRIRAISRPPAAWPSPPTPEDAPSRTYDRATQGGVDPGHVVIRQSYRFLRRGPYAAAILGIGLFDAALRAGDSVPPAPVLGVLFAGLALPAAYAFSVRSALAPRGGLSLILTPAELLLRHRRGIARCPFPRMEDVRVVHGQTWSAAAGRVDVPALEVQRDDGYRLRVPGDHLRIPPEVVARTIQLMRGRATGE